MPGHRAKALLTFLDGLLSILHWRCKLAQMSLHVYRHAAAFNTPLEMQGLSTYACGPRCLSFQYSIGDAVVVSVDVPEADDIFQYSIGDAARGPASARVCGFVNFQYSIGDAGGSCTWFLCVFKFLCRCVWVFAAACWLWLFWFCFLCWCAGSGGVGVCVFFSSASVCAEELHDVL